MPAEYTYTRHPRLRGWNIYRVEGDRKTLVKTVANMRELRRALQCLRKT